MYVKKISKIMALTVWGIIGVIVVGYILLVAYFTISKDISKKFYSDISRYSLYRNAETVIENFMVRDINEIWPEEILSEMDVQDYLMVYYNPWDANYLGYLTVEYDEAGYSRELERLAEYPSTEYIGNYGAEGFEYYEVVAMSAHDDGFIYAITDGEKTIIYVQLIFPGYAMDLEYDEYIPKEYLPKGLDITGNNPTRQKMLENIKEKEI